jgi:peptide/nickel transport system substrate-binding protein
MTLAVRPAFQLLKWDEERNIRPRDPATRAECAYSIYMILKPPVPGGKFAMASSEEPKTLFEVLDTSAVMTEILGPVAEGATATLSSGKLYPVEAKYIPSQSNDTWVVNEKAHTMKTIWKLRKGVKWADGQPITAQDYVFSWHMVENNAVQVAKRNIPDKVAKIETPDPYTLVVYWKKFSIWAAYDPTGAGVYPFIGVYPSHILKPIFDKNPADINSCNYNERPVYSGPYEVANWSHGNYIVLKKNPNYWAGQGLLDNIIFYFTPDTNTMLMQLMAGKLDGTLVGIGIDVSQAVAAEKNGLTKTFNIYYIPSVYWEHVTLNLTDKFLKDINLRKALMFALDRKEMSNKIFMGKRPLCYGPIPTDFAAFNKANVGKYPYDPDKAKAILKAAGYTWDKDGNLLTPSGEKVVLNIEGPAGYAVREQEIEFMAHYWKMNLGITTNYVPKNWGPMINDWIHGKFQGALFAWGSDPADICGYTLYHSTQIPTKGNGYAGENFTRIKNAELDKWETVCNNSIDPKTRLDAAKHIQAVVYDQLPELYLNFQMAVAVIRKGLIGYDLPISAVTPSTWNTQYWYWEKE